MEFEMLKGSFSMGKVIFDLDNIPFKKEGLVMGCLPHSSRIQIDYKKIDKEDVFYQVFFKNSTSIDNDFWILLDRYETYSEAEQAFNEAMVDGDGYFTAFRLIEIHAKILRETK